MILTPDPLEMEDFIKYIAYKYAKRIPPWIEVDDLIQTGREAACKAAETFDESKGVPYNAWAVIKIKKSLMDQSRVDIRQKGGKYKKTLKFKPVKVVSLNTVVVDNPEDETDNITLIDVLEDPAAEAVFAKVLEDFSTDQIWSDMHGVIRNLSGDLQYTLIARYWYEETLAEIAETCGVTESAILQRLKVAEKTIRQNPRIYRHAVQDL